ncbi:MAG: ribonuclease R [Candidatus Eisenbacteria bacterium]
MTLPPSGAYLLLMTPDKKRILDFVRRESDHPMKPKEIALALGIRSSGYARFRRALEELIAEGGLVRLKRGGIGPAEQLGLLVGKVSVNRLGTGFLEREGEEDLRIPAHDLGTALDGDQVLARRTGHRGGREEGAVVRVRERAPRNIVGVVSREGGITHVRPDNPRIHRDLFIPENERGDAEEGQKVVAALVRWDDPHRNPEGKITEVLGDVGEPGVDMRAILKEHGLPEVFPGDVLSEAERAAAVDTSEQQARRLDLTGECVYTIDPADAKDHDDAISIERIEGGYRLGVHIADVSHYVAPGTALDREAFHRGNSVYLPGMVVPMIPESLSNDVCSLRPNRRRLAHSVFIDYDRTGKALKWRFEDTVIRSKAKLAYEEVQEYFDSGVPKGGIERVAESLDLARELARLLARRRAEQGSLDFDLPEAKVILNKKGEVIELGHRVRLEAHRLIEEFMLAANRAVAYEVARKGQPFLYRVHDKPDMESIEAFSHMMHLLGYPFPVSKNMKPAHFSRFLERIKNAPESDFIHELMLRTMQKAVYQRENIGHFGLAFRHYTHFTSPIRRYPDLLVHRLLRELRGRASFSPSFAQRITRTIDAVGTHCSATERAAEAAERQAVKVKQVQYMAKHVGEEFDGVISGTTPHGFFVRLAGLGVDGMVRLSSIDDDYYRYDEDRKKLVGRHGGRAFRMGDPIRVGVARADTLRGEIDLYLPEEESKVGKGRKGKSKARAKVRDITPPKNIGRGRRRRS